MNPEQWARVKDVLDSALGLSPQERDEYLSVACADDPSLRSEVESLLHAQEQSPDSFMKTGEARSSLPRGTKLGSYEIIELIGAGGMGEVYRARDLQLRRDVAIKVLPPLFALDGERLRRFEQEARAAAALDHSNILAIHHLGSHEGQPYIVSEMLQGHTLREELAHGALPLRKAIDYGLQAAAGVVAAHQKDIIHRDLKPENIFVTKDGQVKILDFGLAKLRLTGFEQETHSSLETDSGVVLGTLAYMSPEQARGNPLDARSDIFSLGAVLYEMAVGKRAFSGKTAAVICKAILVESPTLPTQLNSQLPPALDEIVGKALEKDPDLRYQSAADLRTDLKRLSRDTEAVVGMDEKIRDRRYLSVTKLILVSSMVLLMVVSAIVYWRWARGSTVDNEPSSFADVTVTPFTSYKGQEVSPSFSPDGNQIVFAWDGGNSDVPNRFDLYVKVIGSESLLRLTSKPAVWLVPAWSPDGRTIAFRRMADNDSGIFIVSAIGGPERKLADDTPYFPPEMTLNWSPDGKELAYSNRDKADQYLPTTIRILSLETGYVRQIRTRECQYAVSPIFSPDGKWLAFDCGFTDGVSAVFVMPRSGGSARQIIGLLGNPLPLAWTNDSKRIIFSKKWTGDLWEVSREGGRAWALMFARDAVQPAVARRGDRLAYAYGHNIVNLWKMDLNGNGKAPPQLLISSTRSQHGPDISPDGKRITFGSDRSGWREIWVSDFDGSNPVQLTNFHALTGTAKWSPDCRAIVFDSRESGHPALYLVDPHAGLPHKIPINLGSASVPSWSNDGRWIYFTSEGASEAGLYKVSPEGGNAILVSHTVGYNAQEASDGSMYFSGAINDAEIHVIPQAGGKEISLANMPRVMAPPDWTLAPNGIYFVDRKSAPATLSFFDFQNGKVRVLAVLPKQPDIWGGIAITPDQRYLIYSQIDEKVSDIMLAENYR